MQKTQRSQFSGKQKTEVYSKKNLNTIELREKS